MEVQRTLSVKVPPGVDTGTRLKVKGEGEGGIRGGSPGDLYFYIEVLEHQIFKRDRSDLYCEREVSMLQAALGDMIPIQTLEGTEEKVKILEGTQNGTVLTLRGKGMPHLNSAGRGDLFVHTELGQIICGRPDRLRQLCSGISGLDGHPAPAHLAGNSNWTGTDSWQCPVSGLCPNEIGKQDF